MSKSHLNRKCIHGHNRVGKRSPEYHSWVAMKGRCYQPNHVKFPSYGARGIKVCERWLTFQNFLDDMGLKPTPKHTIDRIDNNGNYCKENCRWASKEEQSQNRKFIRLITFRGKTQCIQAWEKELGFKRSIIRDRFRRGWNVERALTTPANSR